MQKVSLHANPFALMMDPEAVLAAMERSELLNHLQSRVCRPLDRQETIDVRRQQDQSLLEDALSD
jgi:hypothetical protein